MVHLMCNDMLYPERLRERTQIHGLTDNNLLVLTWVLGFLMVLVSNRFSLMKHKPKLINNVGFKKNIANSVNL